MSFFSSDKDTSKKISSDIPPEFFSAVSIMDDGTNSSPVNTSSTNAAPAQQTVEHVSSGANPFLGEEIPRENPSPVLTPGQGFKGTNPFLAEASPERRIQTMRGVQTTSENEISFSSSIKKGAYARIFIGAGIVLLVLLGIGGAYYIWGHFSQKSSDVTDQATLEDQSKATDVGIPKTPLLPFALDKPNYISINTETATPEEIKKSFDQAAARIISAGMTQPVEFLVTDQNNNPLAFSRFAYIEKFAIDTELLALVEESFSCYVYNDAGQSRMGLALAFKDSSAAAQIIIKKESGLPYAFRTLLYDSETVVSQTAAFRSGTYATQAVRFVNIDSARNFSFDYVLQGKSWYLGASKDTLHALFDKNNSR